MMDHVLKRILLAAAALAASGAAAQANLLTNGSFETPVVPVGGYSNFATGSTAITGWVVVGNQVSIVSGSYSAAGVSFPAQDGAQWLDLTGAASQQVEGVSQTVATTVGHQYQLSYYIGNTTGGGVFGTTSTVAVQINGTTIFTDTNSAVNPTSLTYQLFTHTFLAGTGSTALTFLNGDPPGDDSNALDNIVLLDLGVPVTTPEPASMLLLGAGLAGLVVARRRSRA